MQHRPAPDHRLVSRIEKTHRNHFQPVNLNGVNLAVWIRLRLRIRPQHQRDVGAIYVGIEQANPIPQLDQRNSQVNRERGFAHSALARADGDNRIHSRQRLRPLRRLSGMRVCVGTQRNHLSDGYSEHCELIRLYRGVAEACVARPLLSAFSLRGAKSPHQPRRTPKVHEGKTFAWVSFVVDGFLKTRESRSQHPSDNRLACGAGRAFQFLQQLGFQMVRIGMHFTSFDFIIGRAVEA